MGTKYEVEQTGEYVSEERERKIKVEREKRNRNGQKQINAINTIKGLAGKEWAEAGNMPSIS